MYFSNFLGLACLTGFLAETAASNDIFPATTEIIRKRFKLRNTSWSSCGSDSDAIQIDSLDIEPGFIHLPGDITVNAQVTVNANITSPVKVTVVAKKKTFLGWITLPCWQQTFGSCTYEDVCSLTPYPDDCPEYFVDNNLPCHCPLTEGVVNVDNLTTTLYMSVPEWLEKGNYMAHVQFSHHDTKLACYEFRFQLA
ncbi:ganglioside GM2 activator-like [Cloeon dipterum]|uniref:ganglioside GM2 activator-like n=1 Tax=Cloeon dipterum TaxID=197152 RepID=UPI00321FCABC